MQALAKISHGGEGHQARLHFHIAATPSRLAQVDAGDLERMVAELIRSWSDRLRDGLERVRPPDEARRLARIYGEAIAMRAADRVMVVPPFSHVFGLCCLHTAMEHGVDGFVEFGGGLGKGEGPAEKRPNLEGIIKKTLKASDYAADYVPAINLATLEAAAAACQA